MNDSSLSVLGSSDGTQKKTTFFKPGAAEWIQPKAVAQALSIRQAKIQLLRQNRDYGEKYAQVSLKNLNTVKGIGSISRSILIVPSYFSRTFLISSLFLLCVNQQGCKRPIPEAVEGDNEVEASGGASTQSSGPLIQQLQINSSDSRKQAAKQLETQLGSLLKSTKPDDEPLREMAYQTLRALREGGDKICPDSAKIHVFRGHGYGLIFDTSNSKKFITANYATMPLPRFSGTDWEAQAQKLLPNLKINFDAGFSRFSKSTGLKCSNGTARTLSGKYNYSELAGQHTIGCDNSIFISTTVEPETARSYKAPVIQARLCPGRVYPTSLQAFATEVEFLAFGFILPEEIVKIHTWSGRVANESTETNLTKLYREGLTNPKRLNIANDSGFKVSLPQVPQPEVANCGITNIVPQNNPAASAWIGKQYNDLTKYFAENLTKQRNKTGGDLSTWIAGFPAKCSCAAYVKNKKPDKGSTNCN